MARERVLITVKTYPTLSRKYGETVCTAGVREDGSWVRIYPVPFRRLGFVARGARLADARRALESGAQAVAVRRAHDPRATQQMRGLATPQQEAGEKCGVRKGGTKEAFRWAFATWDYSLDLWCEGVDTQKSGRGPRTQTNGPLTSWGWSRRHCRARV